MASCVGNDGTESQSFCNSNKNEDGSKSGRMDIAWPNFIKQGPEKVNFTLQLYKKIYIQILESN